MDIAVRIPAPVVEHDGRRPERCDRCGSQGFNLHQRATKALKDPLTLARRRDPLHLQALPQDDPTVSARRGLRPPDRRAPPGQRAALLARALVRRHPRASRPPRLPALARRRSGRTSGPAACSATAIACAPTRARFRSRRDRTGPWRGCSCAGGRLRSAWRVGTGELHLVVSAIQPEAARLLQRRLEEATRRLDLQTVTPSLREVVHA